MDTDRDQIIAEFVESLKKNAIGVAWNCGFDSVIFVDKDVDGNKSLKTLINEMINDKDKKSGDAI